MLLSELLQLTLLVPLGIGRPRTLPLTHSYPQPYPKSP